MPDLNQIGKHNRLSKRKILLLALGLGLLSFELGLPAQAQLAATITGPNGSSVSVTGRNANRGDEALILYTSDYGKETRTNPHGQEVTLIPADKPFAPSSPMAGNLAATSGSLQGSSPSDASRIMTGKTYRVTQNTNAALCSQNPALVCGNAPIPPNGIVLSATGSRREWLNALKVGDMVTVAEDWSQRKTALVNVINPTPQNNPAGSGFPGFRASNQIVRYDIGYGRPNTGTNEFGFEVTVRNGIVVDQEGSDSAIPADGFVLSGHGRGRAWLIANTPVGTHIDMDLDTRQLTASIDFDTYLYQFEQRWAQSPCSASLWSSNASAADPICRQLRDNKDNAVRLSQSGKPEEAIARLNDTLEGLNRRIWLSYQPLPSDSVRGAWHRPVEKSAAEIGKTLDTLKAAGLNAVFLETYFHGYTIFPSQTFKAYGLPVENPKFEGVDLLKLWTDEAHKRNMQVHVWFQTFYAGTTAFKPPGPILAKYPAWANVQFSALQKVPAPASPAPPQTGSIAPGVHPPSSSPGTALPLAVNNNGAVPAASPPTILKAPARLVPSTLELGGFFLDPANAQAREFLMKLAMEIVATYPVDGFQLDYIRYPASFPSDRFSFRKTTWGYTDVARAAFKAQYGIDPAEIDPKVPAMANLWLAWGQFKTQQVNSFVDTITHEIRKRKPAMKISAAVFPNASSALALKHQDWSTWGRNGWIDFYAPMTLTSALKVIEHDTQGMVQSTHNRVPVYSGIFGPFNGNSADLLLTQIDTARRAGSKGYVMFDTAHLTGRMLEALRTMQTPHPATAKLLSPSTPIDPASTADGPSATETDTKKKKNHWWQKDN